MTTARGRHLVVVGSETTSAMNASRRSFLQRCGLLALGGSVISSWTSSLEAEAVSLSKPLRIGSAENAVLDFVGGYSSHARIAGAAVLAKLRGLTPRVTHVIARIDDLAAHQRAWAGARGRLYAGRCDEFRARRLGVCRGEFAAAGFCETTRELARGPRDRVRARGGFVSRGGQGAARSGECAG